MADGGEQHDEAGSSAGYWLGSWIQAAKEKSAQTYELIKADLNEFRNVCSTDATAAVANTAHRLQDSIQSNSEASGAELVKQGFSSILGGITKALTVPPDDDENDDIMRVTSTGNLEMFDKAKARLYELQKSPQTFCTEPDGPVEKFTEWKSSFDLEARKGEISDLLVSINEMRGIYTKLVPGAVSHSDFWERYFYKVHQLEENEKRKAELKMRADKLNTDGAQSWEDDWESEDQPTSPSASSPAASVTNTSPIKIAKPDSDKTFPPPVSDAATPASNTGPAIMSDVCPTAVSDNVATSAASSNTDGTDIKTADQSVVDPPETVFVPENKQSPGKAALIDNIAVSKQPEFQSEPIENNDSIPEISPVTATNNTPATSAEQVASNLDETHIASNPPSIKPANNAGDSNPSERQAPSVHTDNPSSDPDDILVKEKGGYVMLGSERPTPTSSVGSSAKVGESASNIMLVEPKPSTSPGPPSLSDTSHPDISLQSAGTDDDWEKELFGGDDLKAVQELAQKISEGKDNAEVDWEDWE